MIFTPGDFFVKHRKMFSVNGDSIVKFEMEDKTRNGTYFQDRILKSKYNNKNYADSDGKCSQSILGVRIGRKIAENGLYKPFIWI